MCQKLKCMIKTYCKNFILTSYKCMATSIGISLASPFTKFDACLVLIMEEFRQYLESSTIHGLAYISMSGQFVAKIYFLGPVCH